MVVLSTIYTRTGDDGTTGLGDFSRTSKNDPRLIAYADVDEAGAAIGLALTCASDLPDRLRPVLLRIQNDLFDVGADLSTPLAENPTHPPLRVRGEWIDELEQACDEFGADLPTLRSFILAGGTQASAYLHVARTVVRRAERAAWLAIETHGTEPSTSSGETGTGSSSNEIVESDNITTSISTAGSVPAGESANGGTCLDRPCKVGGVNPLTAKYLNRLSDALFVFARYCNSVGVDGASAPGDVLWRPSGGRQTRGKLNTETGQG